MKSLTNEEEALLFQGKDKWHTNGLDSKKMKSISMHDGPNGLRIEIDDSLGFPQAKPAIAFPTASLFGCSFDRSLIHEYGNILAEECISSNTSVLLGPGVNHKRSPKCGRNFEYISEDPVLSGELAASYIQGVQEKKIGTSLKHFATNCREYGRMIYDSVMDERTLHELYLKQFKIAVEKGHPWTIMNAYNKLNGIHCTENKALMDEARGWGFDGAFVSDWGAVYDPVASIQNGLNLEMPGGNIGANQLILQAIQNGNLKESVLHQSTAYMQLLLQRCGTIEKKKYNRKQHLDFAETLAKESIVLTKNEGEILPLQKNEKILLVGPFAKFPRITGAGSSGVTSSSQDNLFSAMKRYSSNVSYVEGYTLHKDEVDEKRCQEALEKAAIVDKVVIVLAYPEGKETEGEDRKNLNLPVNQVNLVNRILQENAKVVLVLETGAPVLLPFEKKIPGILVSYFAGARSGSATASILYGATNPSGKLAETWPLYENQIPCEKYYHNNLYETQFRETIFSGYRYYDTFSIPTQFDFGYGLSYTKYVYEQIKVSIYHNHLLTEVTIKNTGKKDGKEIIELYFSLPDSKIARCKRELLDFEKVFLKAGEEKTVTVQTDLDVMKYYDVKEKKWLLEEGVYVISAGGCRDASLSAPIYLSGEKNPYSSIKKEMFHINHGFLEVSSHDFESILEHPLPSPRESYPFTPDTTIQELQEKKLGKAIYSVANKIAESGIVQGVDSSIVNETCIRQILWLKGVNWKTVEYCVSYMNQHHFSVLKKIINTLKK